MTTVQDALVFDLLESCEGYLTEKGLSHPEVLEALSQARQRWKEFAQNDEIAGAVQAFLDDVFKDGRGTE